ncbi:hypothetical protein GCM10011375_39670 [Hymenobacter qilianensis]|uniref:Uncharacterized protein n=1 Tax=Hymenobacter qilianensis TaxID=1385715 RepID=A0ACB5PX86_9BACT|nr:hypothetical protein [Hymenobacter qilianensis]GGF80651.1 hypothetical protein GCM10011375_39670 [Hymenobacter qilianensis]
MMPTAHTTFLGLPFSEQAQVVWQEGTYLATRYEEEDTVGLYHLPAGFFVELSYDHVANELIKRVRTFTSKADLEDYACYVDLTDLSLGG